MKVVENVLSADERSKLETLAIRYYETHSAYKSIENELNLLKDMVKSRFSDLGIAKFVSDDGISLSISKSTKTKFDEDLLIGYLKGVGVPDVIKTKEYVDMNVLEDALYHGDVKAEDLAPYKKDTVVERLNCSKKQVLSE